MSNFFSRWFCYVALSVLLACFSTLCAEAQVSEITLDNGMRVIIAESHSVPIVAIDAWLSAGTRRESPNQAGVAHFLEHVLFKGTPTHPDEESVDGSIEDLGGTLNAATSYDWAHFYTEVPSAGCNDAITLLADILQHASLKQAAIDEERPIILDEVARDADDPLTSLTDTVRTLTYAPSCAYGRPITGSADAVREVTRDEIVHFYATYYAPNNLTLVVSGDVSPAEVQKCVSAEFGNWKKSTTLPLESSAERSSYRVVDSSDQPIQKSLIQKDANQSYLVMGFKAPSVAEQPDSWDMDVLLTMLGQGGNNRLTEQLKDKAHLVDTISADYLTQKDPGILTISASMPTANVISVQAAILQQVKLMRDQPVSNSELEAAKNALKANYLFDVDTDSGHADSLGFYDEIDTYLYDINYLDRISSVTAGDIQNVAKKYLDPSAYAIALQIPPPDVSTVSSGSGHSLKLAIDRAVDK